MSITEQRIIDKVKNGIFSIDKNARIILFGSRARGSYRPESDWDFLVLTQKEINPGYRMDIIDKMLNVELEENISIQIVPKNMDDWQKLYSVTALYKNIAEDGVEI